MEEGLNPIYYLYVWASHSLLFYVNQTDEYFADKFSI